jgi:hypothetical protein
MKFTPIAALILTIFALNAQAVETCFKSEASSQNATTGKLQMSEKSLAVKWDIDDFTEASKESGSIRNFKSTPSEISGEALIGNISDVGTVWITVTEDSVKFQETDANGALKGHMQIVPRVSCPQDVSPDERE